MPDQFEMNRPLEIGHPLCVIVPLEWLQDRSATEIGARIQQFVEDNTGKGWTGK